MRIAVFGDIHGNWCAFEDAVRRLNEMDPLDLVLQCGDAQTLRGPADMAYLHCPAKFMALGDFWQYYQRSRTFPVPIFFIGGNHEAWNVLDELPQGGPVCEDVEFIGRAGVRQFGGVRIAGISGVYSPRHYNKPHPGQSYSPSCAHAATHYNEGDINRALAFAKVDILLLHEWPDLLGRDGPEPGTGGPGSPWLSYVVENVRPKWVFCGHMHRRKEKTFGVTQLVGLDDFSRRPADACAVLDVRSGTLSWPLPG